MMMDLKNYIRYLYRPSKSGGLRGEIEYYVVGNLGASEDMLEGIADGTIIMEGGYKI